MPSSTTFDFRITIPFQEHSKMPTATTWDATHTFVPSSATLGSSPNMSMLAQQETYVPTKPTITQVSQASINPYNGYSNIGMEYGSYPILPKPKQRKVAITETSYVDAPQPRAPQKTKLVWVQKTNESIGKPCPSPTTDVL